MWRYLAGAAGALLLAGGGLALWQDLEAGAPLASPPPAPASIAQPIQRPPAASEKTREERRFARYDIDKDGKVSREEFLAARRKAYAKLDANGDGKLSFEEWSVKTTDRFANADGDGSATLTPEEFATTRVKRKPSRSKPCIPVSSN